MTDTILLTVPSGSRGSGVVSLVLGGLGSRLDLPVDRIDELALAATTAGASALTDTLELELRVLEDGLLVRVGPLVNGASTDVGRRRVIELLVDDVAAVRDRGHDWLELQLGRGTSG